MSSRKEIDAPLEASNHRFDNVEQRYVSTATREPSFHNEIYSPSAHADWNRVYGVRHHHSCDAAIMLNGFSIQAMNSAARNFHSAIPPQRGGLVDADGNPVQLPSTYISDERDRLPMRSYNVRPAPQLQFRSYVNGEHRQPTKNEWANDPTQCMDPVRGFMSAAGNLWNVFTHHEN